MRASTVQMRVWIKLVGLPPRRVSVHTFPRRCHWKHRGPCTRDSVNCPTTTCKCIALAPWVISHWLGCNTWLNQLKNGVSVSQCTLAYSSRVQSIVTKKEPRQEHEAGAALHLHSRSGEFDATVAIAPYFSFLLTWTTIPAHGMEPQIQDGPSLLD